MKSQEALLLVAGLLAAVAGGHAQWQGSSTTQPVELEAPNPITCLCSDAAVRDGVYYNVTYTCLQQLLFGNCQQDFVTTAIKELPEGYCQVTCGRCACCQSLADVLQANGLNSLLQAAQVAGLSQQLASPASMFTLLAPTDAAFSAALTTLGVSTLAAAPPGTVEAILDYHIIPPHPGIDAVWTTPFFAASNGNGIPTVLSNANLTFTSPPGGNLTVHGASNSANVINADVNACKSYIDIIDAVLLPPTGAQPAPLPLNAGYISAVFAPSPSASGPAQAASVLSPSSTVAEGR